MSKPRRHFPDHEKVAILKRHLLDKVPVSNLCDELDDFVRSWAGKCDIPVSHFLPWVGITTSKYHDWIGRFGKVNEHNAWVPRDHWLTNDEKQRICAFARS